MPFEIFLSLKNIKVLRRLLKKMEQKKILQDKQSTK